MVWSQYSILIKVIHGAQTPKFKIVYVNHLPQYCPVMLPPQGPNVEYGVFIYLESHPTLSYIPDPLT